MRVQMIGCMTAVVLMAAPVAHAQSQQDAKAAEVLAQTRKALGGKKLENLKSMSLDVAVARNVNNSQMTGSAELHIELPDKYVRMEEIRAGMPIAMNSGFNGDKPIMPGGGAVSMQGGAMVFRMGPGGPVSDGPKPTPEQQAEMNKATLRAQKMEISRLMLGWFGMTHPAMPAQYTYAGQAESVDGKAHVIDVKDADGFAARLFIDQNNYLPLMVSYQGRAPRVMTSGGPMVTTSAGGTSATHSTRQLSEEERKKLASETEKQLAQSMQAPPVEISMFFDDWREVDGLQFPHVLRRATAGTTNEEWTINKVKVNPKIDAKKFAVDTK